MPRVFGGAVKCPGSTVSASGIRRCCILLLLLPLILLLQLPVAWGQEPPSEGPPAPPAEAPPTPPVVVPPAIPGPEPYGLLGPIRSLRFAPAPEVRGPIQVRTSLTVEEEYSDNIRQQTDNRQSEFRTSIAAGLAVHAEGSRTVLDLAYTPPRLLLADDTLETATLDHNLSLRGRWSPGPRIHLSLAEDFVRSTEFQDVEDPGTRRTGGRGFIRSRSTGEAAYTLPEGRVGLSYANTLVRNDAPEADNSDTHVLRTDGEFISPNLSLGGSYALTRGDFEIASPYWEHTVEGRARRVVTPTVAATLSTLFTHHDAERGQDFMIGRARLGGTLTLGPDGSLGADAGAEVFAPRDDTTSIHSSLGLIWTQRFALFSLSARYEESFRERFQEVDNTGVTRTRSGSLRLSTLGFRDLTATLGATWTENRFKQTTVAGGPAGGADRTWSLEAGIRYLLARSLALTLQYLATIRTSTVPTAEFLENRLRLGLTYQYDLL